MPVLQRNRLCLVAIRKTNLRKLKAFYVQVFRETLMKAFPVPDLRCEAAFSFANPCASAGGSEEDAIVTNRLCENA